MRLKNNRGNPFEVVNKKYWVFGIYDTSTKNVYLKLVRNRKRETLFPIIRTKINAQSIIWSDKFSVYTGGPNYQNELLSRLLNSELLFTK
jgi:transposase-like protein